MSGADRNPEGRASARCLGSATGAVFIGSLGQRPRDSCDDNGPVLKARFSPTPIWVGLMVKRCVESRFQRWSIIRFESWGYAPGWNESAPLALNRYSAHPQVESTVFSEEPDVRKHLPPMK